MSVFIVMGEIFIYANSIYLQNQDKTTKNMIINYAF